MAEIRFFMTRRDTEEFTSFLVDEFEARFALDNGPGPDPTIASSWVDVARIIDGSEHGVRFFVRSGLWDRYPLITSEIQTNDGRHFWSIHPRCGGPAFDWKLSRPSSENANDLVPGWFSDYPWYIVDREWISDREKYKTFDRPREMQHAYKAVRKYVRRHGCRSRDLGTGEPGPWVLADARIRHSRGLWLRIGDQRLVPCGSADFEVGRREMGF